MRERNRLAGLIEGVIKLEADVADTLELIEMAEAEKDEATIAECEKSLREATAEARKARANACIMRMVMIEGV